MSLWELIGRSLIAALMLVVGIVVIVLTGVAIGWVLNRIHTLPGRRYAHDQPERFIMVPAFSRQKILVYLHHPGSRFRERIGIIFPVKHSERRTEESEIMAAVAPVPSYILESDKTRVDDREEGLSVIIDEWEKHQSKEKHRHEAGKRAQDRLDRQKKQAREDRQHLLG